jgi:zinc/manganese transport system substrate-binding protein
MVMHSPHRCTVIILGLLFVVLPIGSQATSSPASIVVTFSILSDLVHNVSGEHASLRTLVGPDADAHTFEPTPADGVALAKATLIFEHGLGLEPWLDKLCLASRTQATRVVVTRGLTPLTRAPDATPRHHGNPDPHVWHDVTLAIHMVQIIRDALVQHDPAHASVYHSNAAQYISELQQLDTWVTEQVQTLAPERRKLVTSHDTFGYFARRYGFDVLGAVLASFSTEVADPSGAELARLVETIKQARVPAIFAENVQNPRLLHQVATVARVRLAPPLYTDALGKPGSAGDSYIKMMRYNVSTIVQALRP